MTGQNISLKQGYWCDVSQFHASLDDLPPPPQPLTEADIPTMAEVAALYRGDFMAGFTLSDSTAFDDWQFFRTEDLRQACSAALAQLVRARSTHHQLPAAINDARRWLALDPLNEVAHRALMELYMVTDQKTAALRQYQQLSQLLADELDVPPEAEIQALFERIKESGDRRLEIRLKNLNLISNL